MNDTNNQNNGIYEGYIPPTLSAVKPEKPKRGVILALVITPIVLVIAVFIVFFVVLYNAITGGFTAKSIETEYKTNPPQWSVSGRGINGTASKNLTGDWFWIVVDGSNDGTLEIKVTDTDSGEVLLNRTFSRSESCTVDADGKKVEFEVTAHDFSGRFLIHEEYA